MLFSVFIIAMLLELCLARCGLLVPLTAIAGFYAAVVYPWKKSILWQVFMLILLDLALWRPCPLSLAFIPFLLIGGALWRYQGNTSSRMAQLLPGFFLGLTAWGIDYLHVQAVQGTLSWHLLLWQLAATMLATPYVIGTIDIIARYFGRRQFASISRYQLVLGQRQLPDSDYE